jgi:hypothetical protein
MSIESFDFCVKGKGEKVLHNMRYFKISPFIIEVFCHQSTMAVIRLILTAQ